MSNLPRTSDIVSISLRLSKESGRLINGETIQMMNPGALFINTSSGAIIEEQTLIAALETRRLAGAALGVFAHVPLSSESPLRAFDNAIFTSHIAWTVEEFFEEFTQIACTQLSQYLQGSLPASELLPRS